MLSSRANQGFPPALSRASRRYSAYLALRSATACGSSGPFQAGTLKGGVRWNTVTSAAPSAMIGIACTAEEPVPSTATRFPRKSTSSCGHRPV